MSKSNKTKVTNSASKTAREVPIIAWAVEIDGKIDPVDVYRTRSYARMVRNDFDGIISDTVHVRKVKLQVIPGR